MNKMRIKGMLAGNEINIRCTKNQAIVIRERLADWLDEYVTVDDGFSKCDGQSKCDCCKES